MARAAHASRTYESPVKHRIELAVNGRVREDWVQERMLLVHYLREVAGLTGTHVGCVVGECGACSVLVDGVLVKSCLQLAVQADGRSVTTVEGLERDGELDPVQQAFVDEDALMCGFCTPGFIISVAALVAENDDPTLDEIKKAVSGNLCRCGTYTRVFAAAQSAARRVREGG